ncbi:hypothetical protein ACQP2F_16385 [Actinoplanes sp. CA-030573]
MAPDDRARVSLTQVFRWAVVGTLGVLVVLLGAYGISWSAASCSWW